MAIDFMYVQVEILAHSGGKDAKDVTRRCLSRTITPPVAKQINWTGLGTLGKRPFQNHKLVEVIKGITLLSHIAFYSYILFYTITSFYSSTLIFIETPLLHNDLFIH